MSANSGPSYYLPHTKPRSDRGFGQIAAIVDSQPKEGTPEYEAQQRRIRGLLDEFAESRRYRDE